MPESKMSLEDILLVLVAEVEELRANQVALTQYAPAPSTAMAARDTKDLALQMNRESYDRLRKQIQGLAK